MSPCVRYRFRSSPGSSSYRTIDNLTLFALMAPLYRFAISLAVSIKSYTISSLISNHRLKWSKQLSSLAGFENSFKLDFKPRLGLRTFFLPVLDFCSFFPSSSLFYRIVILFYSTTTNERTDEQTNEQTNERTVTLPLSCQVHLLVTLADFLPFALFLFLLTLDRLQR
jgi:hypothetical protein